MKKSYEEGIASHFGPESCATDRKTGGEALTGVSAGWVLSREINVFPGADAVNLRGRQHRTTRYRESCADPARSETPRMRWNISRGNREALHSSVRSTRSRPHPEAGRRTRMMHGSRESDSIIVPKKPSNIVALSRAEGVEGRVLAKGNPLRCHTADTVPGKCVMGK